MYFNESTIPELYKSTVKAYPACGLRQHATNPIKIVHLEWTPYVGMKTLYVKGLAHNEERTYNPVIVFKGVKYQEEKGRNIVPLIDNIGKTYFLEQLYLEKNSVLVRCQCKDFFWRGQHFCKIDTPTSLFGQDRKKYEAKYNPGFANPTNSPMICKHLIKMIKIIQESGIAK